MRRHRASCARRRPGRAESGRIVVSTGLHDVRSGEVGLERPGHRRLHRSGEDRDEAHQPHTDHQRRRGTCGALRIAHGVLSASSPLMPRIRNGHRTPGDRTSEHRPEHRHTDERRQGAEADQHQLTGQSDQQRRDAGGGDDRTDAARRLEPAERSTLTSRNAAIGATLAARRAGSHAESTVTITPTANEMIMSFVEMTVGPAGRLKPNSDIRPLRPGRHTDAGHETGSRGQRTDRHSLDQHRALHLTARRSDRSQHRHLRVRWATVIENVLLMMNAPTNRATKAKISMNMSKPAKSAASEPGSVRPARAGDRLDVAADRGLDRGDQLGLGHASSAMTAIASLRPARRARSAATSSVNSTAVAPAGESAAPNVAMPAIVNWRGSLLVSTVATSPGT